MEVLVPFPCQGGGGGGLDASDENGFVGASNLHSNLKQVNHTNARNPV